jgi:hypothetical protein
VSGSDDNQDMRAQIDELLVTGQPVPGNDELAAFVAALRRVADAPAPTPTPALSAVLRDGLAPASSRTLVDAGEHWSLRPRVRRLARYVAGLSLAAKIVLGAGVAVAAVTGAAGIDAVPAVVRVPASMIVSAVVDLFTTGPTTPVRPAPGEGGVGTPATGAPGTVPTAGTGAPGMAPSAAMPADPAAKGGTAPGPGQPGRMQPAPVSPKIPPAPVSPMIPPAPVSPKIPPAPVSPMKLPSQVVPPASGSLMGSPVLSNPRP